MKDLFEKLFSSQPITVTIVLGALFIAVGAIGGIPLNAPMQSVDNLGRYIFFAVGALFLIVALMFTFRSSTTINFSKNNTFGITLDFPKNHDDGKPAPVENERPEFKGSYKNREFGKYEFRLFVYDEVQNRFWPQDHGKISWGDNGKWIGSVRLGTIGDEKIVIAALVPPSGRALCDYYRYQGQVTNWKPIQGSLPEDFIKIGEVKVKRVA